MPSTLAAVPSPTASATWDEATKAFLRRDLAPGSRRIYRLTLAAEAAHLPEGVRLADLTTRHLTEALHAAHPRASPNSWNRHVATLRSFAAFAARHGVDRHVICTRPRRLLCGASHPHPAQRDGLVGALTQLLRLLGPRPTQRHKGPAAPPPLLDASRLRCGSACHREPRAGLAGRGHLYAPLRVHEGVADGPGVIHSCAART